MDRSDAPVCEVELAQAIAAAVRAVPGVADLGPGGFAGTRERVQGVIVRQRADRLDVEVRVCAQYAASLVLNELAARVRESIRQSLGAAGAGTNSRTDVVFDDVRVE